METLVVLVLISVAVSLVFQMLGAFRLAKERVLVQASATDRRALVEAWFIDSIRGMVAADGGMLEGTGDRIEGTSVSPAAAPHGAPMGVSWSLHEGVLAYAQDGSRLWEYPLPDSGNAEDAATFVFFDEQGEPHDRWPPVLGARTGLPRAVALVLPGPIGPVSVLATVRGRRQAVYEPFELEVD